MVGMAINTRTIQIGIVILDPNITGSHLKVSGEETVLLLYVLVWLGSQTTPKLPPGMPITICFILTTGVIRRLVVKAATQKMHPTNPAHFITRRSRLRWGFMAVSQLSFRILGIFPLRFP